MIGGTLRLAEDVGRAVLDARATKVDVALQQLQNRSEGFACSKEKSAMCSVEPKPDSH